MRQVILVFSSFLGNTYYEIRTFLNFLITILGATDEEAMKKVKKENIYLDNTVSLLWYHIEDNSVTLHKSACYPDKMRKYVGIIYIDDYKGQEGVIVFGGWELYLDDPNHRQDLECLEFFNLKSEVSKLEIIFV